MTSPSRSPRLALGAALALLIHRILVGAGAGAGADDGAGVLGPPHQVRLANRLRLLGRTILPHQGGGWLRLLRDLASHRFFGAADGHFVEGVFPEVGAFRARFRQGDGGVGAGAHVVDMGLGEIAALALGRAGFVAAGGGDAGCR